MHHELRTTIDIDAPPQVVWSVLTDLARYPEWNPFVISAEGSVSVGERLTNRLRPPGGRTMMIRPTVTQVDDCRTFEWLGHLGVSGIFDGRHRFELEATESGTRFTQSEEFDGVLVRFVRGALDGKTANAFGEMNSALKARAESVG